MPNNTTSTYHRRFISWMILILLLTFNTIIITVVQGDEQQQQNDLEKNNSHDHHGVHDHHHDRQEHDAHHHEDHHDHGEEESSRNDYHHDHKDHVHDESCQHDHDHEHHDHEHHDRHSAADDAAATTTETKSTPHDHQHHDHSHSHSHAHNRRPPPKFTPLMISIRDNDRSTFDNLLSDPSTNINHFQSEWPMSALMFTFAQRKYDYAEALIRKGVDVTAKNSDGVNALMLAVMTIKGDEELRYRLVKMLVEGGANPEEFLEREEHLAEYKKLMERGGDDGGDDVKEEL